MNGVELRSARKKAGWTQADLAKRLGVTQAYLSFMESGKRNVPLHRARLLVRLLKMSPAALPVMKRPLSEAPPTNDRFVAQLANLRYPGFSYRKRPGVARHPADVLLAALAFEGLEPRLVEALPWLLLQYEGFDLDRMVADAKTRDLQNRLGFTVVLARRVAELRGEFHERLPELLRFERALEPSRLAREETFGQGHAPERLREWLRGARAEEAKHWNLLTDLQVEHLPYAQ